MNWSWIGGHNPIYQKLCSLSLPLFGTNRGGDGPKTMSTTKIQNKSEKVCWPHLRSYLCRTPNKLWLEKLWKPPQNWCFEANFGPSVIIGLGKIQSYQCFTSSKQGAFILNWPKHNSNFCDNIPKLVRVYLVRKDILGCCKGPFRFLDATVGNINSSIAVGNAVMDSIPEKTHFSVSSHAGLEIAYGCKRFCSKELEGIIVFFS